MLAPVKRWLAVSLIGCACSGPPRPPEPPSNRGGPDVEAAPSPVEPVRVKLVAAPDLPAGTGAVTGTLLDSEGERIIGATVVVTSAALQGMQTAITEEDGTFEIRDLPPGRYAVTCYYAEQMLEHAIDVAARKRTQLVVTGWNVASTGEIIEIE